MSIGIVVQTGTSTSSGATIGVTPDAYFVAGMAERGDPTTAQRLTSMSDYTNLLGSYVSYGYLYNDLTTFFNEGGAIAYVARVVGPSATVGELVLNDVNAQPTLEILAANPGSWSSTLTVAVTAGLYSGTFNLSIALNGQTVEQYLNLSSPAAAAAAMVTSNFVVASNLGSTSQAPANNPAVLAATSLTAGTDDRNGNGSSDTGVTATSHLNAVNTLFTTDLGTGIVCIPGQNASVVGPGLIEHCQATNRITALAPPSGQTLNQATAVASSLMGGAGTEYAGIFWPWIVIPDGFGNTITVPPDGYIAGTRARIVNAYGTWRADFGDATAATWVLNTERTLSTSDANAAYTGLINPIRIINNKVEVYGWESLSADQNYTFLTGRDTLNYVATQADFILEQFIGQPIDSKGALFTAMASALQTILDPMAQAGGLYSLTDASGNQLDSGYSISCGLAIQTLTALAQGQIVADIGIRISPSAELITLTVTKVGFTAAFSG